jgi:hypothetical protein
MAPPHKHIDAAKRAAFVKFRIGIVFASVRENNADYRQTFTQTQYFLKSFQWHCCSIRQFLPSATWVVAVRAVEIAITPATPIQKNTPQNF